MSEINDAAVEVGARVMFEEMQELGQENSWDDPLPDEWREAWRDAARETLTAALPHLTPEPRVITTAEEMEALPIGSVVLDLHGDAGLIDGIGPEGSVLFAETAPMALSYATKHYAPFTVLYTPKEDR